jgi:hypothetical protein
MLTQYKNIDQIQNAAASVSGVRLSDKKTQFASYNINESIFFNTEITTQNVDSRIEIHVYSTDSWITGTHKVNIKNNIPIYRNPEANNIISFPVQPVAIDIYDELSKLNLTSGNFTIAVNFFKNLIGNYERQHLRIDEISPDRTEIRLRAIDSDDPEFLKQIATYIDTVSSRTRPQTSRNTYTSYLLNFSRNQCALFVNSVVIGEYLYVKLYEPLANDIDVDFKCWVVEEQKPSYIDRISILPAAFVKQFKQLANPNWYANASYNISSETSFKNWNELLGSSVQTSQQIIDAYFSGSLAGVKLNIDYSDFNNFVFYSSATERLENFKYKLQLLEYYTSQSLAISLISGSVATTNANDYLTQKNNLIGGFDTFEKFLYFESSSKLTTYDIPVETPVVADVTGSYISPIPKTNSTKPYALSAVSSSQFQTWYTTVYEKAVQYDSKNYNSLIQAIPEFIKFDSSNENLTTFVNMLGHHYDILYTYINHMMKIHNREENPKLGMPNELLYSVAKQFGWNLTDGNQYQDLWQYVLGTNEAGIPLTGSNTVGDPSVPGRDMTYAVWRRIVNNLPLLLKSKGTKRSVQALVSCYGIPQSLITIKEYGGPRLERAPIYEKLNFDYALDLISTTTGSVTASYSQSINTVELRFRTDDVVKNPTLPSTMNLFTVGSNNVTIDFSSGTLGTIQINGTGSANIEMFDGGWLTTMLRSSGSKLEVVAKRSKYGKIVAAVSASATASFDYSGSVVLGGTSLGASRLEGQLQELRIWSSSLSDSAFNNHVKAPAAYDANVDAYDELLFRLPLTQKINHALTSSLVGVQPYNYGITASFNNWSVSTPYDSVEEMYYYDAISLAAGTYDDNKIRIESNELVGTLDFKTRAERSQFDKAPLDSKKLGVYFSPQTMIDEDIIAQLGFIELDDYIGDPGETDYQSYPKLIQKSNEYWKKYTQRNDINAYIKIFTLYDLSLFRQLEQLLPARTDKLTGILVQPNILERSKDTILPDINRFDSTYNTDLDVNNSLTPYGSYPTYTSQATTALVSVSGIDDDQYQAYLTASDSKRYNGTTYSYDYLILSGSEYITASSPYWYKDSIQPVVITSVNSENLYIKSTLLYVSESIGSLYGSSSYGTGSYAVLSFKYTGSIADIQQYLPIGINNQKYNGSKLTSPDFNINSTQTVDGGPVVEWKTANPNQLIYQRPSRDGNFRLV